MLCDGTVSYLLLCHTNFGIGWFVPYLPGCGLRGVIMCSGFSVVHVSNWVTTHVQYCKQSARDAVYSILRGRMLQKGTVLRGGDVPKLRGFASGMGVAYCISLTREL